MTRPTPATLLATMISFGLLGATVPARAQSGPDGRRVLARAVPPSPIFERFEHEGLSIQYPSNWRVYEAEDGASFAPDGGVKDVGDGRRALLYGLIVGHYEASGALEDEAAGLVSRVLVTHPYLRPRGAPRPQETEPGALTMALSGRSSVTGEEEWVTIHARRLPQGRIVYAFAIVPGPEYDEADGTFSRMVRTIGGTGDLVRSAAGARPE
jgi:hypothetical protein